MHWSEQELEKAAKQLKEEGPARVLINAEGEGLGAARAREKHGIKPDIIFIRRDGWTLGAPDWLEAEAFRQWPDQWVAFMRRPEEKARLIAEYHHHDDSTAAASAEE